MSQAGLASVGCTWAFPIGVQRFHEQNHLVPGLENSPNTYDEFMRAAEFFSFDRPATTKVDYASDHREN